MGAKYIGCGKHTALVAAVTDGSESQLALTGLDGEMDDAVGHSFWSP